ncbi:Alpha/Beta hydrolase protein [Clohesyomyces aquaticus]|uniref:Alpha/Beta hydrolase protein n=1 Tax=Clohesyomyces aquaticus TaxID=1231657 RepID=A0A1Y2A1Y1_9PLEO|nr:Alpha/Beta hydrolase protein [Clohesyomyces aquaticus]
MSSRAPNPGRLGIAALFVRMALVALWRAVTYPIRTDTASTLLKDAFFAGLRSVLHRITIPQSRYLSPSTRETYFDFCKAKKIEPQTLKIEGKDGVGVVGYWIGSPNAEVVVLYLHGGGYTQSATPGYCHYWHCFAEESASLKGAPPASTLLLGYSLAPEAKYPTQLQEAAAALLHLVNVCGKSPANIFVAGDSAGGHLAITLLSHLLRPRSSIPEVTLSAPLRGLLLISPWVCFRTDYESFARNANKDMVEALMLRKWAAMYLDKSNADPETDPGYVSGDAYSEPMSNDADWWKGADRVVSDVFVWTGGNECFADPVKAFEPVFKKGWSEGGGQVERVVFVETPGCAHIEPIMGVMMNPKQKSEDQQAVESWLNARLVG